MTDICIRIWDADHCGAPPNKKQITQTPRGNLLHGNRIADQLWASLKRLNQSHPTFWQHGPANASVMVSAWLLPGMKKEQEQISWHWNTFGESTVRVQWNSNDMNHSCNNKGLFPNSFNFPKSFLTWANFLSFWPLFPTATTTTSYQGKCWEVQWGNTFKQTEIHIG